MPIHPGEAWHRRLAAVIAATAICTIGHSLSFDGADALAKYARPSPADVGAASADRDTSSPTEWPAYGLDADENSFSRLAQARNALLKSLGLAWS